jgi:hypothetical protein
VIDHPAPSDEGRHIATAHPLWNESWYFDFHDADGSFGGYVRLGLYPNLGVSWFWACVAGRDRQLVIVYDHEAPLPRRDELEVRASALWTDVACLEPLERFSVQLEAFGLGLDDPAEMYGRMRGDRVPLGLDLEWETDGGVFGYPDGITRYEIPCVVHGEVLVGPEKIDFDGFGQRDHSWGVRDWWSFPWCWFSARLADGERIHCVDLGGGAGIGYRLRDGAFEPTRECSSAGEGGRQGLVATGRVSVGGLDCALTPVAWAPVLLRAPDGRESRLARGLVQVETRPGHGAGWIEWNQPALT